MNYMYLKRKMDKFFKLTSHTELVEIINKSKSVVSPFKPFEILVKSYSFDKYTRKIKNEPHWKHHRYYKTNEGAEDGIKAFRNSIFDLIYRDYPALGNIENENKYPHIKPTITVKRYKIIKRF